MFENNPSSQPSFIVDLIELAGKGANIFAVDVSFVVDGKILRSLRVNTRVAREVAFAMIEAAEKSPGR